ncbi:MAG: prephenate dehydratase [Ruminococcaceae bacterium]|nr:prephenate dehydratase [Oscillospiraceae bacterium]
MAEHIEDISVLRARIDEIDAQITPLFEERMEIAAKVAAYKAANGLPTLNAGREAQVLGKNEAHLKDKAFAPYLRELYQNMMRLSRNYQQSLQKTPVRIGYQGVEGSFSYEACSSYIAQADENAVFHMQNYETFEGLCMGLLNADVDVAVIPFENSSTGPVVDVYDLLLQYDFYIVGEVLVKVSQNLMAAEGATLESIRQVYSHPQAFLQSKEFLNGHSYVQIPHFNTATAAKFVAEQGGTEVAAIASEAAARRYGLKILAHNINYNENNITKFIVLSRQERKSADNDKVSMVISLSNAPGSLYETLKPFYDNKVNMMKIESRPDRANPFDYIFFIDFAGNTEDSDTARLIEQVRKRAKTVKYLGNYRAF